MKKLFLAATSLVLIASCASTAKKFKVADKRNDEGVAFGRIRILYNDKEFSKNCRVLFNTITGRAYQPDESGFVVLFLRAGENSIRRIECNDVSLQHYGFKDATFTVDKDAKNYFGDVTIHWKNKGGFKASGLFGSVGAITDAANNDGVAHMKVSDQMENTLKDYKKVVPEDNLKTVKSLSKIGMPN